MRILVAVDGSEPALHALAYAVELLRLLAPGAHKLMLVSVHDDVALRHAQAYVGREAVADYLHELSENELKTARTLLDAAGMRYEVALRTGPVAQEIVGVAEQGRFDLIAMGTKGRGAFADILLGSVAQRVLATARAPVVLVK